MAMKPDLGEETLSGIPVVDLMNYTESFPNLSDCFEVEEQSIIPSYSYESLDVQSTPSQREVPKEILEVVLPLWKKLGEESFHSLGNSKHQFTERGCALKENTFQIEFIFIYSSHTLSLVW